MLSKVQQRIWMRVAFVLTVAHRLRGPIVQVVDRRPFPNGKPWANSSRISLDRFTVLNRNFSKPSGTCYSNLDFYHWSTRRENASDIIIRPGPMFLSVLFSF